MLLSSIKGPLITSKLTYDPVNNRDVCSCKSFTKLNLAGHTSTKVRKVQGTCRKEADFSSGGWEWDIRESNGWGVD